MRGAEGWALFDDVLYIEWHDPLSGAWLTALHRRDQGGPGAWGVEQTIPATDQLCDGLAGPLVVNAVHLARLTQRRGSVCGVPDGSVRLGVEMFGH